MRLKVSIIIPTKNEEINIGRCLTSIQLAINNGEATSSAYQQSAIEIIVVDNYSTDQTKEISQQLGARVFTAGPERSAQRNFGAKMATGSILFFVDADMEIEDEVLSQAISVLEADQKIAAIIVPEVSVGKNYWSHVRALERSCYLNESEIEAARIFRKEIFLKVGGFDENLIAAEDWDLSQRIKKLGTIGRIKNMIVHHEGNLSLRKHLQKKFYYARNIKYYARRNPDVFKNQTGASRILIFIKHWKNFLADPLHAPGVIILKSLEYLTFIYARFL